MKVEKQAETLIRNRKKFISVWGAGMAAVVVFNVVNRSKFIQEKTGGSNLAQYAAMCLSFLIAYLAVNVILQLELFGRAKVLNTLCGIACLSLLPFMYICWRQDTKVAYGNADTYLWHMYPTPVVLGILIILALLYETVAANLKVDGKKERYCFGLYYALIICCSGFLNHFPEYLSADYFHGSAVFNSIYNVMHGVPYGEITNSVYGNYALLLAIPVKIFAKGEYFGLSVSMSLLTMLCVGLCIYVLHNLIEQKEIRILCAASLLWVYIFRSANYWQLYPMRILCPVILIAWMVFLNKHRTRVNPFGRYVYPAITWLILVLSVVWNKESGGVCLIGYLVYAVSAGIAAIYAKKSSGVWGIVLECLVMITSLPAAYMTVGLYNIAVGGEWITWQTFLFPLFTRQYIVDELMLGLWPGIWPWMAVAFLFLGMVARLGLKILRKEEIDPKECIYAATSVIGLGLMTYFMNRAVYMNLTICYYEAIICIGGIAGLVKRSEYGQLVSTTMRTLSVLVLVALIAGETLHLGSALYSRSDASRQEILKLRDQIREDAQEDTYAFGINIPELYSILGWETRSYTTDWADVFITRDAILNKLYDDLESEDTLITSKKTFERYKDVAEYVNNLYYIEKTYAYSENVEFYLMKKK